MLLFIENSWVHKYNIILLAILALQQINRLNNYKSLMTFKSNLNKNHWNDSMHIFFSPKLSLEGKNLFPQIIDNNFAHRDNNFLTVFKKPIVNVYDKMSVKKQRKPAVLVVGQAKQVEKRNQTTQNKRRNISAELQEQFIKSYKETLSHMQNELHKPNKNKGLNSNKINYARQKFDKQKLYFYVGPGNNGELVEQIMSRRLNWVQTTSSLYHLRWQQARPKYQNGSINKQLLNHLPNHQVISDKVGLVNSLKSYCEKNQQQMFSIIPACFYFDFDNLESCENQIKKFIQFYYEQIERIQRPQLYQQQKISKSQTNSPKKTTKVEQTKSNQSTTTFNSNNQSRSYNNNSRTMKKCSNSPNQQCKKRLEQIKQLHRALLGKLKTHYNFVDMSVLKKQNPFISPIHYQVYGNTCLWLLKPADLNRGRGIHLFRTIQQLGDLLKTQLTKHQKGSFLVQKYIEKPMLIKTRKFDIRVYSMITQHKEAFFFKEGYIRTSSTPFSVNSTNYFTHLTNNAIQKYSKTYGQFQQGNILPLNFLFKQCQMDQVQIRDQIRRKIIICTKSSFPKIFTFPEKLPNVCSSPLPNQSQSINSSPNLNNGSKTKYFQIFGYDFMLDQTGHVWLIQVNTNPCIQLSNQWLKHIIPRMLNDAFKLTIDKYFPKGKQLNPQAQVYYPVPQYKDDENMWEYLDLKINNNINLNGPALSEGQSNASLNL